MGRLGPARTFMLCPSGTSIKLPSDLAGVTYLKFDPDRSDNNLPAAVRPAAQSIRKAIADLGFSETRGIQRLSKATDDVQHKVHDSVTLLLRSRIWETEVFRKHYGIALDASEKQQLDEDLTKLRQALDENAGQQCDAPKLRLVRVLKWMITNRNLVITDVKEPNHHQ